MIGRQKEINQLNKYCDENRSNLVAVYGRRRIGKTYFVRYMFEEHRKDCTFFDFTGAYNQNTQSQIDNFVAQVFLWFNEEPTVEIKTWTKAFIFLTKVLLKRIEENPNKKLVLFFDEVPWVDKSTKAGYISALGYFWNNFCERYTNFLVIVCGSNASWIKKKLLNGNEGPFNNRIDNTLPMYPFNLKETKDYLINEKKMDIDNKSILELYMIFGGVAKYLSYIDASKDIDENISNIFFGINGRMFNEYTEVFKSLFTNNAPKYKKIMDFLATKKSGLNTSEIAKHLEMKVGATIKDFLDDLSECGFIKPIASLGSKGEYLFIVSDPYCLFYNDWMKGISKNKAINLPLDYWNQQIDTKKYTSWSGFAFEIASIINIDLYLKARGKAAVLKNVYSWNFTKMYDNDKGAQIDLVIEYDNNSYDLVECKYWKDIYPLSETEKNKILNKKAMFIKHVIGAKVKYKIDLIMLTAFGSVRNKHYNTLNINSDIQLQDLLI